MNFLQQLVYKADNISSEILRGPIVALVSEVFKGKEVWK